MAVDVTVETATADPPKVAVAPLWKSVPAMVIAVPPEVGPLLGLTEATLGAGVGPA